jgi:hypothetical protein
LVAEVVDDVLKVLAEWLAQDGPVHSVHMDYLPDSPDTCAGLFQWDLTHPEISDGTCTRFIQIRVRDPDYDTAMANCEAIAALLDSGEDETPIELDWPGAVIGRRRRGPLLYERVEGCVTVYAEVALWGQQ